MKIQLSTIFNQDGAARYKGTFVKVHDDESESKDGKFAFLRDIGEGYAEFRFADGSSLGVENSGESNRYIVESLMPHARWMQYGKHSIYIQRTPARQWKRSLSAGTHRLVYDFTLVKCDDAKLPTDPFPELHHSYVKQLDKALKEKTCSFAEALQKIEKEKYFSVAIDGDFCLFATGELFLSNVNIAKVFFKQQSYRVYKLFNEEVRDLTRGLNFKEMETDEFKFG